MKIKDLTLEEINEDWLLKFLKIEFKRPNENITPVKILSVLGIGIHDQTQQLEHKSIINKIKLILRTLKEKDFLMAKNNKHGTLGIREESYKINPKVTSTTSHSTPLQPAI